MGGVDKFPFPKATWSPAGGWWHETPNWKPRTAIAFAVLACATIPLLMHSKNTHIKFPSEDMRKLPSATRPASE